MKGTGEGGGEIIQVQGGHILRSTGRKDRHSKVFTSKGPRDRRVRLSAHTAIQFYDIQDRLGYDRPSKAVDWLIKKAKNSIDKLAELPPWNPNDALMAQNSDINPSSGEMAWADQSQTVPFPGYAFQMNVQLGENSPGCSSFQPQPVDSPSSIAETMKSFFPATSTTSSMNFQDYPHDIMPRPLLQNEDLCLSLQSLQYPNSIQAHAPDQSLFPGSTPGIFEANYLRPMAWNGGVGAENRDGLVFNSQSMPIQLCQGSDFPHGGPLQSSFPAHQVHSSWDEQPICSANHHQFSISGGQFNSGRFPGFQVPARIHGEEEHGQHSASSTSPHH